MWGRASVCVCRIFALQHSLETRRECLYALKRSVGARIVVVPNACENTCGDTCMLLFKLPCSNCGDDHLTLSSKAENHRQDVCFCVKVLESVRLCACVRMRMCVRVAYSS